MISTGIIGMGAGILCHAATAVSILVFTGTSMLSGIFLKKMPHRTLFKCKYVYRNRSSHGFLDERIIANALIDGGLVLTRRPAPRICRPFASLGQQPIAELSKARNGPAQ
jgi:hypothetical protein